MKSIRRLAAILSLALLVAAATSARAKAAKKRGAAAPPPQQQQGAPAAKTGERLEPDDSAPERTDVPQSMLQNRREQLNEDADSEIPYYNNYMSSYKLGPEDVISVTVFDLPKWSRGGITVPPDGRIDY